MSQHLLMQFDQCGARVTEASIVVGQLAKVSEFAGRQGAQASLSVLGPGNHRRDVERPLVRSAVTGGLAATGAEVIDGTFDELSQGEQGIQLTPVVIEQRLQLLAKTAGAFCGRGQGNSLFMLYIIKT